MQAVQLYQARGDGPSVARAALEATQLSARPDRVLALLRAALEALAGADPHLEARLLVQMLDPWSVGLVLADSERESIRRRPGELADAHGFQDVRGVLLLIHTPISRGSPDRIATTRREAHTLLAAAGLIQMAAYAIYQAAGAELAAGRLDAAYEAAAYARANGVRQYENSSTANLAAVLRLRCEFERFDALAAERESDIATLCFQTAQGAEMAGDIDSALGAIETFITGSFSPYLSWRQAGLARLRMRAGQEEEARSHFNEMREALADVGGSLAARGEFITLVMLDDVLGGFADDEFLNHCLRAFRDVPDGMLIEPISAVPLDRFQGGLLLAVGDLDEAHRRFEAGLALCEREALPRRGGPLPPGPRRGGREARRA